LLLSQPDRLADEVYPGLVLAGSWAACTGEPFALVVTCCADVETYDDPPAEVRMSLRFPQGDGPELPDRLELADVVAEVVATVQRGGRTFVRCAYGLNRSGLVAALALRHLTGRPGAGVVEDLRRARSAQLLSNQTFARRAVAEVPVVGWRIFGLGEHGALELPFMSRYWRGARNPWPADGALDAVCDADVTWSVDGAAEHPAPAEGCTCGIRAVTSRREALTMAERRFLGQQASILEQTGVLARVAISGKILPGHDIPDDDPPSTVRGERATLLDVHLAPHLAEHATTLERRYAVPVATYTAEDWPHAVDPARCAPCLTAVPQPMPPRVSKPAPAAGGKAGFLTAVRAVGFGPQPCPDAVLLTVAESTVRALRADLSISDLATGLYGTLARPSLSQARAFVEAAITHLAPDTDDAADAPMLAAPPAGLGPLMREAAVFGQLLRPR
jgi:hypothetical protein